MRSSPLTASKPSSPQSVLRERTHSRSDGSAPSDVNALTGHSSSVGVLSNGHCANTSPTTMPSGARPVSGGDAETGEPVHRLDRTWCTGRASRARACQPPNSS